MPVSRVWRTTSILREEPRLNFGRDRERRARIRRPTVTFNNARNVRLFAPLRPERSGREYLSLTRQASLNWRGTERGAITGCRSGHSSEEMGSRRGAEALGNERMGLHHGRRQHGIGFFSSRSSRLRVSQIGGFEPHRFFASDSGRFSFPNARRFRRAVLFHRVGLGGRLRPR